ncbi:MAG: GxxExxY protein [Verrucomicrobia bacterium]|nr:GxxExxY protein [Verrucomicrobiota bacterium]
MNEPSAKVDQLAKDVVDACVEVHRILGPGYLESLYEEALAAELSFRNIPFERQKAVNVDYKGKSIGQGRMDFLVADCLVVELKTVEAFAPIHTAQVISYLKATGLSIGLLLNFNTALMKQGIKRIILTH